MANIKINLDSLKTRRDWKRHKVKDGSNVFRILPPFGESSNGYPYRKWMIIWGLTDPESGRARPFASSMTSEKKCPVFEYVTQLKSKAKSLESNLLASGMAEDAVKERLGGLNKLIQDLNPKTVYIYNAADKAGDVGLLELKSTAHKKMKTEMAQYIQDYNQDPTSLTSEDTDSGVWFNVTRQGLGRDTEYDVKKMQIKTRNATGKMMFEDDRSALPESVVENYNNLAYDLASVYQVKTYEELEEILQANMLNLIEACADADLGADGLLLQPTPAPVKTVTTPAKTAKPTGTKPVTVKLDDENDGDANDEFMAEADALLNS